MELRNSNAKEGHQQTRGGLRHRSVRTRRHSESVVDESDMWRERHEEDMERYITHHELDNSLESRFAPNY
jgi:hypothetical protein